MPMFLFLAESRAGLHVGTGLFQGCCWRGIAVSTCYLINATVLTCCELVKLNNPRTYGNQKQKRNGCTVPTKDLCGESSHFKED